MKKLLLLLLAVVAVVVPAATSNASPPPDELQDQAKHHPLHHRNWLPVTPAPQQMYPKAAKIIPLSDMALLRMANEAQEAMDHIERGISYQGCWPPEECVPIYGQPCWPPDQWSCCRGPGGAMHKCYCQGSYWDGYGWYGWWCIPGYNC